MNSLFLNTVPNACSAQELIGQSYLRPDPATAQRFLQANSLLKPSDRLMRGELYAIPGFADGPPIDLNQIGQMVARTNFTVRSQPQSPAPEEFNANFGWMKDLLTTDTSKVGMQTVTSTLEYFEKRAENIATTFRQYQSTYELTAKTKGFYKNNAAKSARIMLERDLQAQLTGITRARFLQRPHGATIKDQLNISHRALSNQIKLGTVRELDKIEVAARKAAGMAKHLKRGGKVIKLISLGKVSSDIYSEFATGGIEQGLMKTGEEGFGLAGSAAGAKLGGAAGGWAAGVALAAFGVGTGGAGFVVVAIGGVVVGSMAGSMLGEWGGKAVWGEWGDDIYTAGEDAFAVFQQRLAD